MKKELSAENLKNTLWETLQEVKEKKLDPLVSNAVATQSREIMRIVKTQIVISKLNGKKPNENLISDGE